MRRSQSSRLASLALGALVFGGAALAQPRSDAAREKRWAEQILPGIVVGEPVWLESDPGSRFLALHARAERPKGAVILVHGPGLHPDHGITGELRMHLAERGYTTLSLQMPVLDAKEEAGGAYQALFPEAAQRIASGARFLAARGDPRFAIVSHAMGSGMTYEYLRVNPGAPVTAWVALSFYGVFSEIGSTAFPVFDVYGKSDYRGIRGPAGERRSLLERRPGSRQLAVPDGGRFLAGGEATLLREVPAFLDAVVR